MKRLPLHFFVRLLGYTGFAVILMALPLEAQQVPPDQTQPKAQQQSVETKDGQHKDSQSKDGQPRDHLPSGSNEGEDKAVPEVQPNTQDDAQTQMKPDDKMFPENLEQTLPKDAEPFGPDQKDSGSADTQGGTQGQGEAQHGKEQSSGESKDLRVPSYQAVWDKYPVLSCKFFGTYLCQDGKCNFEKRTKPSMFRIDFAKNMLREHTELEKATINKVNPIVNRIWQKPRAAGQTKSKFKKALVRELHDGTFIVLDGGEFHLWTLYEEPQKKLYRAFYNSHTLGLSVTGTGVCLPSR